MKKVKNRKPAKTQKKASRPALKAADIQNVRLLADQLGKMLALSGYYKSSFNLKTLAESFRLTKFIPKKAPNKKEAFTGFLRELLQERPRTLKKLVREVMPRAIEKRLTQGDPILEQEALELAARLETLGVKMRPEIIALKFPKERPSIVPPPKEIVDMLKKFKLHPVMLPDCETQFAQGHLNGSVRSGLEKFEAHVQQISGLQKQGFDLMMEAFEENNPLIKLNVGATINEKSERAGFRYMAAGIMRCWRNLVSHGNEPQMPYQDAFARLACISSMFHALDKRLP